MRFVIQAELVQAVMTNVHIVMATMLSFQIFFAGRPGYGQMTSRRLEFAHAAAVQILATGRKPNFVTAIVRATDVTSLERL